MGATEGSRQSMCGILGIVARDRSEVDVSDSRVTAMRDTMAARGPDDATLLRRQNVVLAHRRLAIRDPSAGTQPWLSDDGQTALIYNGEIYNDESLRRFLMTQGFHFRTRCDTEVLMNAWLHWGPACVEQLRGMFAFAVYDFASELLFLARDRFGIKPLFHAEIGSQFVFASSIAAISKHPGFTKRPNWETLGHYLATFRITLDSDTVYKGIKTLQPARTLLVNESSIRETTYWSPPSSGKESLSYDDAVDRFHETISQAVSIRLRSDVPVGMMLSGGVDSNLLACLLNANDHVRMTARCGGGRDSRIPDDDSDFHFARRCAEHVGFEYDEVRMDADAYQQTWMHLLDAYQTPVSTPTDAIIFRVAERLRKSVGVAIGGEGADEVCCGYTLPHYSAADYDLSHSLQSLAPETQRRVADQLLKRYGTLTFATPGAHYLSANSLIHPDKQAALFREPYFLEAFADGRVEESYDARFDAFPGMSNLEKTAHVLLQVNLECLLARLDSATMWAGLEARVPYTDHHLVEQVLRQPFGYRIDRRPDDPSRDDGAAELVNRGAVRGKRVLRSVAERLMPPELSNRPKASFPTPVPYWLANDWRPWVCELYRQSAFANEVFRPEAIDLLTQMPEQLSAWHWPLVNMILWGEINWR
ncbi:MAG: asparagine synthase (glutamine-hydrolyzing) [Pirellulaceae bacterium]